jgi:FAD binding domain
VRRGDVHGQRWLPMGEEREVTAAYVIGCDGANSLVRERTGTPVEDLGFVFDWLIADTIPRDPALLAGVNLQRCDPTRPTTLVSGGPGRRRWEWMLLPGEDAEQVQRPAFVWEMLERSGIGREEVELERHTVYTFRARWAQRWREGRMLLAGDAAHLMPPFAGQGMCSGIRDALALSWHLDLVLSGRADESTLDAYTTERCGHLQHAIATSVELGKVICISDEREAAARDEALLSAGADPTSPPLEPPPPNLGPGIHDGAGAGGSLFPQGFVEVDGRRHPLEDTISPGFALYALGTDPAGLLDGGEWAYLEELGCASVELDPVSEGQLVYRRWFEANGCSVALVRPDFYVFGTASTAPEANALVHRLRAALGEPDHREERLAS